MVWESIRNKIIPLSLLLNGGVERIIISSNIGLLELTTTAQYEHAVGSYFILIGQFVKTTVAINVGDTITVGTNVQATDVASVLLQANNKISAIESNKTEMNNLARYNCFNEKIGKFIATFINGGRYVGAFNAIASSTGYDIPNDEINWEYQILFEYTGYGVTAFATRTYSGDLYIRYGTVDLANLSVTWNNNWLNQMSEIRSSISIISKNLIQRANVNYYESGNMLDIIHSLFNAMKTNNQVVTIFTVVSGVVGRPVGDGWGICAMITEHANQEAMVIYMDTWSNNPPAFAFGRYSSADNAVTWKNL